MTLIEENIEVRNLLDLYWASRIVSKNALVGQ